MIKNCTKDQKKTIYDYIGNNYSKCLYLYLNIEKYGFESDKTKIYIQTINEKIVAVLLTYYSCVHIYSDSNEIVVSEIVSFVEEYNLSMIYCTADIARKIWDNSNLSNNTSTFIDFGWVAQIEKVNTNESGMATVADEDDFNQIIDLIYGDESIGKSYRYNELKQQLLDRVNSGYTRHYVVKDHETVVSHACTNAETKNIAVTAELIVNPNYRKMGYATEVYTKLCNKLLSEGKEVFAFYFSDVSRNLHKKIGFFEVCEWGKIVFEQK